MIRPLQALQNLATKKILGVFKTAPIIPLELKAVLPLLSIRLNYSSRCYILRALKLNKSHLIRLIVERIISRAELNCGLLSIFITLINIYYFKPNLFYILYNELQISKSNKALLFPTLEKRNTFYY
jgi:hypothetical protein